MALLAFGFTIVILRMKICRTTWSTALGLNSLAPGFLPSNSLPGGFCLPLADPICVSGSLPLKNHSFKMCAPAVEARLRAKSMVSGARYGLSPQMYRDDG
jgi:hypothetical protein